MNLLYDKNRFKPSEIKLVDLKHIKLNWSYFNSTKDLPRQGFKIHISAHIGNAREIFNMIVPFLLKKEIAFKTVSTLDELKKMNIGLYGISQIGKCFTIYPDQKDFPFVIEELYKMTHDFKSPIISSDIQYKDSIVYYRYGVIKAKTHHDQIQKPDGSFQKDLRCLSSAIPYWVNNPIKVKVDTNHKKLLENLVLTEKLRSRGRGAVYSGLLKSNNKTFKVIAKEARPYAEFIDKKNNANQRIKNEAHVLQILQKQTFTPKFIELRSLKEHSVLIMQKLEGISLKDLVMNYKVDSKSLITNYLQHFLKELSLMHEEGIVHGDISFDNILFGEKAYLIDFEYSILKKQNNYQLLSYTKHFSLFNESSEVKTWEMLKKQDFFGLIMCLICIEKVDVLKDVFDKKFKNLSNYKFNERANKLKCICENIETLSCAEINKKLISIYY